MSTLLRTTFDICVSAGWLHEVQWVLCTAFWTMDMTGVYACLGEAVCDVTTVPSHLKRERQFYLCSTLVGNCLAQLEEISVLPVHRKRGGERGSGRRANMSFGGQVLSANTSLHLRSCFQPKGLSIIFLMAVSPSPFVPHSCTRVEYVQRANIRSQAAGMCCWVLPRVWTVPSR